MGGGERRDFARRCAAFCASTFFGLGIILPFFPLWLAGRGLNEWEIGAIVAAPVAARILLAPPLTQFADRLPGLGHAAALYAALAGLLLAALTVVSGFWAILLVSSSAVVLWNTLIPLGDAVILVGVRRHGVDYARVRLWGSAGFIAANLAAAAVLERTTPDAVIVLLAVNAGVAVALGLGLPRVTAPERREERVGFRRALADAPLRRALFAANLVLAGHGAFYAFGSLHWRAQGFPAEVIGALWAYGVVVEIGLFWAARYLPDWGPRGYILIGSAGAVLRWTLFPFAVTPAAALALQTLHALTFALTFLGVMTMISAIDAPGHTARVQAANQVIGGLLLAGASAAAGPLFRLSPIAAFWAMAVMAVLGAFLARRLPRRPQPQSAGGGGATSAPE